MEPLTDMATPVTDNHLAGPPPAAPEIQRSSSWRRPAALLAVVAASLILARVFGVGGWLAALREWIAALGSWGPLVFLLVYVVATVAALPGSVLSLAAGSLFGAVQGIILVSIGATLGASLAFLLGRYVAREATSRWLAKHDRLRRLDNLTAAHGAVIVALTRLVPLIPFNLLNYALSLTQVPFWTYVFWTWLCMLPGIALYVVGADALTQGLAEGQVPWGLIGILAVLGVGLTLLIRQARRELERRQAAGLVGGRQVGETQEQPPVAPLDDHNRALLANVQPADWVNPEPRGRYNLVVIGAGTAGLVCAAGAAGLGARVALVERHLLGGDCLTYGCVPSKAIIRSARAAAAVRAAAAYGINVPPGTEVDFAAVMARMRRLRADISHHDAVRRFQQLGVDVFLGAAHFTGPDTVAVGDRTLQFAKAVIATGGRPAPPDIPGLAEAGFLTNETVFSLTALPARLLVLGAGPLGCELAQAFQRLGSQVYLLHKHDRPMNREDPDAALVVQASLVRDGVHLLLQATPLEVRRTATGKVLLYESRGRRAEIEVDEILAGTGRAPNVEGLNLAAAGVKYAGGRGRGVLVNDYLQTSNPNIYAAGDVCLPYQFTHLADAAARLVIQNALFFGRKKVSALTLPWCTYTDPEVAHVGLSEAEARKRGIAVQVFIKPLSEVDRAILDGETEGFVKILVKSGTDKILGATIVASHAGEMISEVTTAMAGGLGLGALAAVIHPYPTQAEAIRQTGDLYNRSRLTPTVHRWLTRFLAWRR